MKNKIIAVAVVTTFLAGCAGHSTKSDQVERKCFNQINSIQTKLESPRSLLAKNGQKVYRVTIGAQCQSFRNDDRVALSDMRPSVSSMIAASAIGDGLNNPLVIERMTNRVCEGRGFVLYSSYGSQSQTDCRIDRVIEVSPVVWDETVGFPMSKYNSIGD